MKRTVQAILALVLLAGLPVLVACASQALAAPDTTPTAAPKAGTPTAMTTRTASPPGSPTATPDSSTDIFSPDFLPTMMAAMPTAPAAPEGQTVILTADELGGSWDGWMTMDYMTFDKAPAEVQQGCDQTMSLVKGKALPMQMSFEPTDDASGIATTVTLSDGTSLGDASEDSTEEQDLPYTYTDGTLTILLEKDGSSIRYEARIVETGEGQAMTGTWAIEGPVDRTPTAEDKGNMSIGGVWTLTKLP